MRQHGGGIHLETVEGRGSTFSLYFPRAESAGPGTGPRPGSETLHAVHRRILVVEDEPGVRRITRNTIEHLGCTVDVAEDGAVALQLLLSGANYDAVVSDVMMPRMGGPELLRRARAAGIGVPFVFVSGYATENFEGLALEDGRVWILAKPWLPHELTAVLDKALTARAD